MLLKIEQEGAAVTPTMGSAGFVAADSPLWADFLNLVRHDIYHRPEYVAFDAARSGGRAVAFLYREQNTALLVPFILRSVSIAASDVTRAPVVTQDLTSPFGYAGPVSNASLDDDGFWRRGMEALLEQMRAERFVACFVRLHPLLPPRLDALGRAGVVIQHRQTVSIDLGVEDEEYRRILRPSHRREIKRARLAGAVVRVDDWGHLDDFRSMYEATMSRVGADDYYFFDAAYFDELRRALGASVHLATVHASDGVIGGGIFFECDGVVQYHLGATRSDALNRQPAKLLIDEMRLWAGSRGNRALHLGGGVGGRDGPLFRFKAGFSSDRPPFFTWRVVADRSEYLRLTELTGASARDDDTGRFPAYRFPGASR